MPVMSEAAISPCWLAISTSPSRPSTLTSPRRAEITTARFPGNADIHIGCDRAVAGALGIGIQSYDVAVDRDLRLGGGIVFVRVSLAVRIDPLVRGHVNLVIVRSSHVHRAAITVDAQAAARRKVLLELVFVTVVVPEQSDILVAQIDVVANLIPVEARSLGGRHSEHDQENQQQHTPGSDPGGACAFSSGPADIPPA